MTTIRRSVILHSRPQGAATLDDFAVVEHGIPALAEGEVLTRTLWLSIDPYMRGRMDDVPSYAPSVKLGEPMIGETVGEVIASRHAPFVAGQIVLGARGWQSHIVSPGAALTALPDGVPYSTYLGVLGMPGATAYAGLRDIGKPQPGETLVVAAASGAVGSVVVQLAKRAGARVVGIAGGVEKGRYVREVLGADACIDHRAVADLPAALREACPQGIDVYFESVGGAVQRAVYPMLNDFGRMVMCGMVAEYDDAEPAPGPNLRATFRKRLRIQGFIVHDRSEAIREWRAFAAPLLASDELRYREQVVEGLENAPAALLALIGGSNEAKVVVRVADPSPSRT
ncbi:NADP-dependent oxidoreductase [Paraburkholderia solisilvae]|uniref:NADPH-dependent curcumin reductase n=1 Tax=Paraburkholderia solisilvae TaxID=624376 RepID=A0A6J5D765_9BURK|nr:NADP-dependent oxidoreductase [Paraburkholderia solisilvae]CAB3748952.1 NADPH-dependent curcumin reductase [Paraburkholderia solisilvae]